MTETAHTPLPWTFEAGVEDNEGEFYVCHAGTVCTETTVCNPHSEADARFIVQAVNSHHRLIEALEDARTSLSITRTNIMCEINRCADPRDSRWEGVPEILKERIAKIDAALKEAGRG